jgi:hypothetical protein
LPRSGSRVRVPFSAHLLNKKDKGYSLYAQVAELVDAHVSGACVSQRAGSSPVLGTFFIQKLKTCWRGGGIGRRATLRG